MSDKLPALYVIDETIAQLVSMRDDPTITDEERAVIDAQLQEWIAKDVQKLEGCYGYIRHEDQLAEIAQQVIDEALAWKTRHQARSKRVKDMVQAVMEGRGQKRAELPFGGFTVQGNGGVRPMEVDEALIPEEHHKYKFELSSKWWKVMQKFLDESCGPGGQQLLRVMFASGKAFIDSDSVRKSLEAGIDVPGAKLADRGKHLRLR